MREIEKWLSSDGIPAAAGAFPKSPRYPCRVYLDETAFRGDDQSNRLAEHNVTLELYNDWNSDNFRKSIERSEKMTEKLLHEAGCEFLKQSAVPIKSEREWKTVYEFTFIEQLEV